MIVSGDWDGMSFITFENGRLVCGSVGLPDGIKVVD